FYRYVSLDKLKRKTRQGEPDPPTKHVVQPKGKNKGRSLAAVPETRFHVCKECGEELCNGGCREFHYEAFERIIVEDKEKEEKNEGLNLTSLLDGGLGLGGGGGGKRSGGRRAGEARNRSSHLPFVRKRKKKKKKGRSKERSKEKEEEEQASKTGSRSGGG
ncbi:unnamed protein product, partial [Darwinula stevensoni]